MIAWQATVQDESGNVVPLPVVTVYNDGGTELATIYGEFGGILPNPLTGTLEGFVQFWAVDGRYEIEGANGADRTEVWEVQLGKDGVLPSYAAAVTEAGRTNLNYIQASVNGTVTAWVRRVGGTCLGGGWSPAGTATPEHWGAVGDGITDDRAAFIAADAAGVSPVDIRGNHFLSSDIPGKNVAYRLTSDASVSLPTGVWNPRRYYRDGVTPYDRKVNFASQNPTIPPEDYTGLSESHQAHYYWINQWGYQEPDTNGNLSGAFSGPFPPGQTRLARSGAQQIKLEGRHSGMGDGYNLFGSMAAVPQTTSLPVTNWSGQNSAGFMNFQVNATGAKVNLYGIGDCVLDDKGYQDVAMLGHVSFISRNGADSGGYNIPRFGFLMSSRGALPLDHAYGATGPFHVGLDLARASFASNFAIMLGATHRLGFDGSGSLPGKFTTNDGGSYYIHKANGPDRFEFVAAGTPIFRLYNNRAEINPGSDNLESLRVRGSSTTAMAAIGQSGSVSYFTALTTAAEATSLVLRAADATGVEQTLLSMTGSGRMTAPRMQTYADNAAALAAGRVAGDIYKTATGELRIVI